MRNIKRWFWVLIPFSIILIFSLIYIYFTVEKAHIYKKTYETLNIINSDKAHQIEMWFEQYLNQVKSIRDMPFSKRPILDALKDGNGVYNVDLINMFKAININNQYQDIVLVNNNNEIIVSLANHLDSISDKTKKILEDVRGTKQLMYTNFYECTQCHHYHHDIMMPVIAGDKVEGVIVFRINTMATLFNILDVKMPYFATFDLILLEEHNDSFMIVNRVESLNNKPFEMKIPQNMHHTFIDSVVLGKSTHYNGKNFNGVKVIGHIHKLKIFDWYLIASANESEMLNELYKNTLIFLFIFILLSSVAIILYMHIFNARERQFLIETIEHEKKSRILSSKYEMLSKNANDMIIITDNDDIINDANDKAIKVYGSKELIGLNYQELQVDILNSDRRTMISQEIHTKFDKSRQFYVEVSENAIEMDEKVFRIRIIRDISERKAIEKTLNQANEYLSAIVDSSAAAIYDLDQNARVKSIWNKGAEELFGWKSEEIIGHDNPTIPEMKVQESRMLFKNVMSGIKQMNFETMRRRNDGTLIPILLSCAPIYDSDNNTVGAVAVVTDISDINEKRKQLQDSKEELQATEEELKVQMEELEKNQKELFNSYQILKKLEFIVNNSPSIAITWYFNKEWKVDYVSDNINSIGIDKEKLMSQQVKFEDYLHPDDYWRIQKEIDENLNETVSRYIQEYRVKGDDGKVRWIRDYNFISRDNNGKMTHINGIITDITENKKIEEEILQIRKMDAIGQLAGGIAHDFNNLLGGIMGNAELLLMECSEDDNRKTINQIIEISERASSLTKKLLLFARKGKYHSTDFNINEKINDAVDIMKNTIDKSIRILCDLAEDLPTAEGDPVQIESVFLNIGINARDAMSDGGTLKFKTERVEIYNDNMLGIKDGIYSKISIVDTGIGMNRDIIDHIFEPFFTTKEPGKGTGLGLPSAYGIVKNHNGIIKVYSEPGQGTEFRIYLPAKKRTGVKGFAEIEGKKIEKRVIKGTGTILIVDDEEMIRISTEMLLKKIGYTCYTAETGQKALDFLEKNSDNIDIIILDMIMPEMGGRETFYHIKRKYPHIKIILSSGFSEDHIARELIRAGADAFIQKPFGLKALSTAIADIVE